MSSQKVRFYEFADFRLDPAEKILLCNDKPVSLAPKVFDTLKVLTENHGRLLEKDELMREIWQDRFVEEGNLAFNVKVLRKVLGDNTAAPQFIETVPRRGYRFIAEVKEIYHSPPPGENNNSKRFIFAFAAVLCVGVFVLGAWYSQQKSHQDGAPVLSAPFALEKLSTNGKIVHAIVSSDGKKIIYTNGTGNDRESIWLRELETGSNIEIIPPSEHEVYAGLALSPDGNTLYFASRSRFVIEPSVIYRVSIFGGIPQKIVGETQGWFSISPDGAQISFVRCNFRPEDFCSLWIADAADGKNESRLVSYSSPFRIADNKFSPDGKRIAFAAGQSKNSANEFSLMEVSAAGGAQREVTADKFFNIKSIAWVPDQSSLLITAAKVPNKNYRIWEVSNETGKVFPLTNDSESYAGLSLDKNARFLISTQVSGDFRLRFINTENSPKISANGTTVFFAPNGKIVFSSSMTGNDEIWIQNADGSERKQLTSHEADDIKPIVSNDNNSIFFASNRTGAAHIWRINADGGNPTQITRQEGGYPLFITSDGRWIYYHHGLDRTLWRVSASGEADEQPVFKKGKYSFAVSPDGTQAAFAEKQNDERILTVISLVDGQAIKTFKIADRKMHVELIAWMPDGKNLAYTTAEGEFANRILWLQPLSGNVPQQIAALGDEPITSLAAAPDGKTFAVAQGFWRHDMILLRGLKIVSE